MLEPWMMYMVAACIAGFGIGWIIAWAIDEWRMR
jgi:hypothetical protein